MSTRPRNPGHGAPAPGKLPITDLVAMKENSSPIAMITAYDAPSGRLADVAGADVILVGDSAAMTVLGHDSTVPATMEEMLMLTRAVTRGARRPLIVADMPSAKGPILPRPKTAVPSEITATKFPLLV